MRSMEEDLANPSFWDERYSKSSGNAPTHEWFQDFESLKSFVNTYLVEQHNLDKDPCILHLGCGDSVREHTRDSTPRTAFLGYKNQICIDFSSIVIQLMSKRYSDTSGIKWVCGDVRDMSQIGTNTVDIAFDKGTLDAMISGSPWNPPDHVKENIKLYLDEITRVLKPRGVFLYISFRQPHFMRPLLTHERTWDLAIQDLNHEKGSFGYFGYVMKET